MFIFTVLLYTTCTYWLYLCVCVSVCVTVHCCTTWHYLNTHLWCTHYARISYTAVRLYCSPFSVHSGPVLLCIQLHCTTVHSLVPAWPLFCQPITKEQGFTCFALIGPLDTPSPLSHHHHQLNHSMLTTSFPEGNGRGKNKRGIFCPSSPDTFPYFVYRCWWGGQLECQACTVKGARTPIGASKILVRAKCVRPVEQLR